MAKRSLAKTFYQDCKPSLAKPSLASTKLRELQERRPRERVREIPAEIIDFVADQPLVLDGTLFSKCLASAPAGSAPGPGGCTNELLKVCLDDVEEMQFLFLAARDGGARGIATGTSFRRLIAKTLARQFGKVVESACAPFQFALSTRAGTDCVEHAVRVMTDADPDATILSVDGVGAYDHVLRSNDEQTAQCARLERVVAFRQVHICAHNKVHVGGR